MPRKPTTSLAPCKSLTLANKLALAITLALAPFAIAGCDNNTTGPNGEKIYTVTELKTDIALLAGNTILVKGHVAGIWEQSFIDATGKEISKNHVFDLTDDNTNLQIDDAIYMNFDHIVVCILKIYLTDYEKSKFYRMKDVVIVGVVQRDSENGGYLYMDNCTIHTEGHR